MSTYAKIQRLHYREGLSISEIARRTSLSRNTIKRWLRDREREGIAYARSAAKTKLDPFFTPLQQWLATDAHRPKRDRRTLLVLFRELQAQGYAGSYSRLTIQVRRWRMQGQAVTARSAYVPLHFAWGEAYQFDWSEEGIVIGGVYRRVQMAHLTLCASRAFWLVAYPGQSHEMLFDAHTRAFAALGGVARRGIYDNMRTAVDKVGKGKERIVNARFAALCGHYLIDWEFCNRAAGWEKGRVEKNVLDARRGLWTEVPQTFASFAQLNAWLADRCRLAWRDGAHPEHPGMSIAEALEHEQPHLMPMPKPFDGYVEHVARVSSTCLVTVQRNRYSVPCRLAGHKVSVRLYPERVAVIVDQQVVANHGRALDRDHIIYDWQHYIPLVERKPGALRNGAPFADMPEALIRLQRGLLRRPGGDRVMAQVLAAVPAFGLEAVLVAVELVLETSALSADHVLNVLARLRDTPIIETVATTLQLHEEPLADPHRYDQLHGVEVNHV